jgi:predicted O-methyltransferase YrrM
VPLARHLTQTTHTHREQWLDTLVRDHPGIQRIVEIGVFRGRFASQILTRFPDAEYLGVDPWRRMGRHAELTAARLAPWPGVTLRRVTSLQAAAEYQGLADLVYIDGSHHRTHVLADLRAWSRLVRPGGIVAGHDYTPSWPGVIAAVQAFMVEAEIPAWSITRGCGDGSRDPPTFFWVVPDHPRAKQDIPREAL